ncbi:cobyrinate a,c-diamide synthase [Streptomyces hainanensis]|uniref:Hydrogenobyrinate a,c-diamide synthase n=1 Tax=Streptomyces hainanensis TaxID=402648 RepID=A0A4R4SM71_9ACTN|nr:cobyrinate a,c-diamide synthase [Streptomyces hainanensis]TDC63192.1 cobyrinate a,c-diamide synthase [Streptomyces hainanensis]
MVTAREVAPDTVPDATPVPLPPRLVVAAPASGSGKTTVATGLMAAFTAAGLTVSGHKVGPDYIDPGYHALATGRPGRNLDAWLCGPELMAPLFAHGSAGAELAVIEGVMGLYDGAAGQGELASTAQVAKLLRAPVVLVVDAAAQARSVAALAHGFAAFDPEVRLAGVVLNKVGSDRHEELLRAALDEAGTPVLGVLRRTAPASTPARHLGLVPAAERPTDAARTVAALGEQVRAGLDLPALLAAARSAPSTGTAPWRPPAGPPPAARPVVAVAAGAAFTFRYQEHLESLTAAGADIALLDPLRDERLPDGTAGLVVGGGFPEVYAAELAANAPLRAEIARLAAAGAPVAAECGGLLYLAETLDGHPMCGVLPTEARMTDRLTLGYRAAVAVADGPLAAVGTRVRGHEFHRTELTEGTGDLPAWGLTHPTRRVEGFHRGGVHASYLHLHWAGLPEPARRLVAAAARHTGSVEGGGR